jgi:cytochrome c oxidase assembly factor CtaG
MGLLPASPLGVTDEVRLRQSREWVAPFRVALAVLGVVLWILFLVPPVSAWAARYEFVESLQFGVFAFAVPALLVSGAPWRRIGLASHEDHVVDADGLRLSPTRPRLIDRVTIGRARASHQRRAVLVAGLFAGLTIFWRVAPVVDYLVRHRWLAVIEALSLLALGIPLFTNLIESPPMTPGTLRPYRIGISAGVMWVAWVVAYLDGMSHSSWYHAFHHVAGQGISLSADQQLSAGFIWLVSAAVFIPIVFWNLVYWLQSEEDPNDELQRLVRDERTRGFFGTD